MWDAQPGEYTIMTRATDAAGNTQPDEIPFNEKAISSTSRPPIRYGWRETDSIRLHEARYE